MSRIKDISIVVLILGLAFFYLSNRKNGADLTTTESILKAKQLKIVSLLNDNGELIQQRITAVVKKDNLETHYKEAVKDIEQNHNLKIKNIENYYRGKLQASGSGKTIIKDSLITVNDTVVVYKNFISDDHYLSYRGSFFNSELKYSYTYTDSLSYVTAFKKVGNILNRKKQYFTSAYSQNPNSSFKNGESIKIHEERVKNFSAGFGVGVDRKGNITPQLQVQFTFFRF